PGTLRFDVERRNFASGNSRLRRRDAIGSETVNTALSFDGVYFTNVSIGTPPQNLSLFVDTGSADMWFWSSDGGCEHFETDSCEATSAYSPSKSLSYQYISSDFSIGYADDSSVTGDFITESVVIGGATLENLTVGLVLEGSSSAGIIGVGYPSGESVTFEDGTEKQYQNLPVVLREQGYIGCAVYSLWLNDIQASRGSILFGGLDVEKFDGNMIVLPINKDDGDSRPSAFNVNLRNLGVTAIDGVSYVIAPKFDGPVLLDSGTTLTNLPADYVKVMGKLAGAVYNDTTGLYTRDCSVRDSTGSFDFEFDGATMKVQFRDMFQPVTNDDLPVYNDEGQPLCEMLVYSSLEGSSILGDSFLRSVYVVYDLQHDLIGLAQTRFNSTDSKIYPI
ncbi:aspartic peptidase domain-containing protein, partial [Lipomyces oligophaga]|uniref:aspartic peptidase domain-containing protein n=1 Tax=Lipomyces oligophaga TaxID=45792 RepID=UPI0034CF16FB